MSGEPLSTRHSPTRPPAASEHINLAERFVSFAAYAAHTEASPQPGAASLDVARLHAFTGELTFAAEPPVRLYVDGGSVYYGERDGDPSVGELMLDAEVLDAVQLQRGVVRVGGVDHLGRLFDRDATIDRDAVMVVVENATDALVQEVAGSVVATVTARAYRHHPSGLHRWFVGPSEATALHRPASAVMQIDRTVVDDLPQIGAASASESVDADVEAEMERFDADRADWAASSSDLDGGAATAPSHGGFHVVWPDGSRELASDARPGAPSLPDSENTPSSDAAETDDVAAAVRRALDALGSESARPHPIEPAAERRPLTLPHPDGAVPVATDHASPAESDPMGFPPPTLETSAAAIYERAAAAAAAAVVETPTHASVATEAAQPTPDRASRSRTADTEDTDDATARRGALRRLIGSLRSKD